MSLSREVKVSKMKQGFFTPEELDDLRLETAKEVWKPYRDQSPLMAAGVSGLAAIAAYKSDAGLLATLVVAGVVGALTYLGLPKLFDKLEERSAEHVEIENYRLNP